MHSTKTTMKLLPLNRVSPSPSATIYRAVKEGQFFTTTLKRRLVFVRLRSVESKRGAKQLALF